MVAGDGNAYVAYPYREVYEGSPYSINHLVVLQIGSDGSSVPTIVYG